MNRVFLIVIVAWLTGCAEPSVDKPVDAGCEENHRCEYVFKKDMGINVNQGQLQITQKSGTLLFRFSSIFIDDPKIADDEITESLLFEVSSTATSFMYHDLTTQNVYYTRSCFCGGDNQVKVTQGYLHGTKIADQWQVTGEVIVTANGQTKTFQFEIKPFLAE
ncbi:MAG: hypothetical protein ACOYW3_00880 [Bacteroidota bacterium]